MGNLREMRVAALGCAVVLLAGCVVAGDVVMLEEGEGELATEFTLVESDDDKSMWTRNSKTGKDGLKNPSETPPPGSDAYKTIKDYEHHGKCRFACYQDKLCGGYSWQMSTHTCKLLAAPNFLSRRFENDRWHKEVSKQTGAKYKPDPTAQGKKEAKVLKKKLKKTKKVKPIHKRPRTINGHIKLNLNKVAKKMLKSCTGPCKNLSVEQRKHRAKLYMEFLNTFSHDYDARVSDMVKRRAHSIADKRIKKADKRHKKSPVKKVERHKLFKQAKKDVEGHAVREMQRSFKKHVRKWVNAKLNASVQKDETNRKKQGVKDAKKAAKKAAKDKKEEAKESTKQKNPKKVAEPVKKEAKKLP